MPKTNAARKPAVNAQPLNVVNLKLLDETPGAFLYVEVDAESDAPILSDAEGARIGRLYFRKKWFGQISAKYASEGVAPERLTITIEEK
jgi:hypothetical protein